ARRQLLRGQHGPDDAAAQAPGAAHLRGSRAPATRKPPRLGGARPAEADSPRRVPRAHAVPARSLRPDAEAAATAEHALTGRAQDGELVRDLESPVAEAVER